MKRLSKKLSVLLTLAIMLTSTLGMPFAMAETQDPDVTMTPDGDELIEMPSQVPDETVRIDVSDYIVGEEISLEPVDNDAYDKALGQNGRRNDIAGDTARANDLSQRVSSAKTSSQSRATYNYSGSVTVAGQYVDYGPYNIAAGEMIEAIMYTPAKIPPQYVLSIYYLSGSVWQQVDYSALGTGGGVGFESVGVVNNSGGARWYLVSVETLTNGNGDDTFNLTVNTSTVYDIYEPNNSIYYSGGFIVPEITPPQYFSLSANLHSAVDVEWFRFLVPTDANYSAFYFTEINTANVSYELFEASNGYLAKMTKDSDGGYSVNPDQMYYYRISPKNTGASYPRNYTFELRTYSYIRTSYVEVSYFIDSDPAPMQTYTSGGTRYAFLGAKLLEVYVHYYLDGGVLNVTENSDLVEVKITDIAWSSGAWSYLREGEGTALGGVACIPVTTGHAYGQVTVYQQYGFFLYDYSVTLSVFSTKHDQEIENISVFYTTKIN